MSQLPTSNIKGITPSQCGLIFLATPHTGTTKADWSHFIVAAAGTVAGVRPEVISYLQSFNPASVWDKKAFLKLSPRPPFRCFAEGRKKLIKGTYQHVSPPIFIHLRILMVLTHKGCYARFGVLGA